MKAEVSGRSRWSYLFFPGVTKKAGVMLAALMVAFFLVPPEVLTAPPPCSPEQVLSFARSLYGQGQYRLSLIEYRRFLFSFPGHGRAGEARMGEADCLFWLGNYDQALNKYLDMARDFPQAERGWESALKAARCYQLLGQNTIALDLYRKVASQSRWPVLAERARFDLGWSQALQGKWKEGSDQFQRLASSGPYGKAALLLSKKVQAGAELPSKSPTAAGVLSGFLPGAGQLYCEQPRDAGLSVLLNGLFIWAAVESFNRELYMLGGILTLIETAWYGGNIYNAVNHAHKYNRRAKKRFLAALWEQAHPQLSIPLSEEGWYRLLLNIPF